MKAPNINFNHFKVFSAVFENRSMTNAAIQLHLTQSGVSQHIKAFEQDLGISLFTRVGRKLVPTSVAIEIYNDIEHAFARVTSSINKLNNRAQSIEGVVRIGMPIEFGNNVIIPKLTQAGLKYPKITFEITLDYASTLAQHLISGQIDFAYLDETPLDRRLQYKPVATENLLLCASRDYLLKKTRVSYTKNYFEKLDYIEYKGAEPILRRWMLHHLKRKNLHLNVRAHIMDVQGVAKFITTGLGAGVLPDHVLKKLKDIGFDLYVFEGGNQPLKNEIRLTQLKSAQLSPAVLAVLNEL